jgi:hypothetical protein
VSEALNSFGEHVPAWVQRVFLSNAKDNMESDINKCFVAVESKTEQEYWDERKKTGRTQFVQAIERVCRLQALVERHVFESQVRSDCFCNAHGETDLALETGTFDNRGAVLDWIESAVASALRQYDFDKASNDAAVEE